MSQNGYRMSQASVDAAAMETPLPRHQDQLAEALLDRRIARGITGSFLVSVLTIPFGYLTILILARVSPEVVGMYGILGIYLGIISSLIYFGGGTVTVRFMSELPSEKKARFFSSYYLLTLLALAVAAGIVVAAPGTLEFLLGSAGDFRFYPYLVAAAPLLLLFFSSLAALKGLMHVTLAQSLMRAVTVGACFVYGYFLLVHGNFFRVYAAPVVFVSYFVLILFVSVYALHRLRRLIGALVSGWQWFLPGGFWGYALKIQGASTLGLLHTKIDQILVLRQLDLSQLGVFYVILQVAETSPLLAIFFVEGVLPGMTNLFAAGRLDKISELYGKVARYSVLMATGLTCFLLTFCGPLLSFFGERYVEASSAFVLIVLFSCLDSLGPLNHTAMVGMNKPNYWSLTQLIRIVAFVALFTPLTDRFGLVGVALARGVAWSAAGLFGYYVVLNKLPFRPRIPVQFFLSAAIALGLTAVYFMDLAGGQGWGWKILLFLGSLGVFLVIGKYGRKDYQEIRTLLGRGTTS